MLAASQRHGHLQLIAQQADHVGHTLRATGGQGLRHRSPDQHATGTQCHGLEHIGAPAYAAIHQHGHGTCHGLRHTGQGHGGGRGGIERAPTVVGHDDPCRPRCHGLRGVGRVQHAFEQNGQAGDGPEPGDVVPGGGLVQRAEAAGYEALVLTVDAPTSGIRDRERRAQFRLPPGIGPVNLAGLQPAPAPQLQPGQSALFDGLLHQAPTWDDIAWLRSITRLPVLLKGVLHPADATQAVAAGAAGVIVSNHGGRTLDTAPPTAVALPRVAQAVAGAVPVLVDGGIRRGTDVLKAMALGASAVLVGRPAVHGLAHAGAAGVAHVLRLLRDELEVAMALTGCKTLADAPAALSAD